MQNSASKFLAQEYDTNKCHYLYHIDFNDYFHKLLIMFLDK